MFTGLTQPTQITKILKSKSNFLVCVKKPKKLKIKIGDSINLNGICSTIIKFSKTDICFEYIDETLKKTTAPKWKKGENINLETSLKASNLLGGHLVSGHIECVGIINKIIKNPRGKKLYLKYPPKYNKYIISKGSIAINGVSLTVIDDKKGEFSVSLIAHTIKNTNLGSLKKNDKVNLEFDIFAKYLEKLHA